MKNATFTKAVISGRIVWLVLAAISLPAAAAERFEMEGSMVETATANVTVVGKAQGELPAFFEAQKKMTLNVLNDMGIPFESLPANVREKLSRYHTTNFEAFKLFSRGLDAQDQGKFAEAKALFEKAVELDPNFDLAAELSLAMPNTNATNAIQLQAVLNASSRTAVSDGKVQVEVDLSQAIAALQSGRSLFVGDKTDTTTQTATNDTSQDYTSNPAGSGVQYANYKAVGMAYQLNQSGTTVSVASTNEWLLDQVVMDASGLVKVGGSTGFSANRGGATSSVIGQAVIADGSNVTWGSWANSAGASASISTGGTPVVYPELGSTVQYMMGQATPTMPTTGSAVFAPGNGFLNNASGTIGVDFVNRVVTLNSLGFDIGSLQFSGLTGTANYAPSGSGFFNSNYTGGACTGCSAFSPTASSFTGNFLGTNADGLMYSTIMQTGTGTAAGVHLFTR